VSALTGMVFLVVAVIVATMRLAVGRLAGVDGAQRGIVRAFAAGLLGMCALGLFGIVMGGNWWVHYLTQLAPFLAMGVGLVAATPGRSGGATRQRGTGATRRWANVLAATTLLTWCGTLYWTEIEGPQRTPTAVGDWLRQAARPGDTALVTWGHANVLHESGLATPYRLAWSLPVRVQDPHLDELDRIMRGPDAPTWIVEWRPFESWGLDPTGRVRTTVWQRYERVPDVCGKTVYRLRSRAADPLPVADAAACSSGRGLSIRDVRLF
ncbi:MAG: hypothetical protein JWM98_1838, partial [Thermoleophilia bacterium]|nr:hypothetical protein [Thermoleophilia bacterium]